MAVRRLIHAYEAARTAAAVVPVSAVPVDDNTGKVHTLVTFYSALSAPRAAPTQQHVVRTRTAAHLPADTAAEFDGVDADKATAPAEPLVATSPALLPAEARDVDISIDKRDADDLRHATITSTTEDLAGTDPTEDLTTHTDDATAGQLEAAKLKAATAAQLEAASIQERMHRVWYGDLKHLSYKYRREQSQTKQHADTRARVVETAAVAEPASSATSSAALSPRSDWKELRSRLRYPNSRIFAYRHEPRYLQRVAEAKHRHAAAIAALQTSKWQ
ncbi:unnamed protein product [Phytophthora lilii]|uniref:Unnamed protein product n=1 Tax=Phytophthora lilii TaxID=2077276 RepID=A0A9W6WPQ8_9STRA|nr:unnamed protein product [Phytophthora lilii]